MLVLLYTSVKSAALGVLSPTPVAELAGYETFIRNKFLNRSAKNSTGQKLCYATGKVGEKVDEVAFNTRYSLNKMFVTTTRNYASRFDTNNFRSNYQVSEEAQKLLERGSSYILENHTIPIAGVNHCIIPQVFSQSTVDASAILAKLSRRSDLLFKYQELKDFSTQIDDTEPDIYWIDFLGYESDGNFFKTIHYIKDVSKTHFTRLLKTFQLVHRELKEVNGIQWDEVMSAGKNHSLSFNLFTFYGLIPLRKDKEKKNEALTLFKAILEQRKISSQKLFEHYRELILCHRFERYRSYTNVYANNEFDFAVRNATYQYLAIFQVLTRLNLLKNMEEKISTSEIDIPAGEFYQQQVELFFTKMAYSDAQKALFYLGRTLNAVAYAQVKKEHASKPILEKVNFNGLDNRAIMRLRNDLMEKTKQYRIYDKTEFLLSQFTQYYNPNEKKISPEEALFFLLSGYSFRLKSNA
jgi:CRISPR-associated protein Csh1